MQSSMLVSTPHLGWQGCLQAGGASAFMVAISWKKNISYCGARIFVHLDIGTIQECKSVGGECLVLAAQYTSLSPVALFQLSL